MKPGRLKISEPKSKAPFIWKYFDLHRFIYLISERRLFFTRLDKFNDPFEGVATKLLRRDAKYSKLSIGSMTSGKLSAKQKRHLNEKRLHDYIKNDEVKKSQNKQYVNCWFACDRESMAMWNLYSNQDSVAVKIPFEKAKEAFSKSFKEFILLNENRLSIIGDEIVYLKLNPFDETLPKQHLKYSALKKDISFQYEKEYRFLIVTIDNLDKHEPFYTIPINIEQLDLTVIAHPNMEDWKFKNLEKLLELSNIKVILEKSATVLKSRNGS